MSEAPRSLRPAGLPDGTTGDNTSANVDSILQSVLGRWSKSFGMAAVVLRGNCIVGEGVAGVRKKGAADPITLNDQFHLGSCGKAMTATLIAMLVDEGRLSWTTTLGGIFADTVKDINPVWTTVTLPQILAHGAGLRLLVDRALKSRVISSRENLPHQRLEIARHTLAHPPKRWPGGKFSWFGYSNVGYVLAGAVLEYVTGRAWEDLMRERLFLPLGITTGGFGAPGTPGKINQPWGHALITGKPVDPGSADLPSFYGPAGLAHMTVPDWAKFVGIHLRGNPANPQRQAALLQPDTFAALHTNATAETYSGGWKLSTDRWAKGSRPGDTGRVLWHAGSNGRWFSVVAMAPEIDFAVLLACNRAPDIATWKIHQAGKALIRRFAAKPV
jgi:CubicO group peptidase (beta-lactamase class C family)